MWLDFLRLKLSAIVVTTTLICVRENHIRFKHLSVSAFDRVLPVIY